MDKTDFSSVKKIFILLSSLLVVEVCLVQCSDLVPDQLHCVSEVSYKNWDNKVEWYIVNEYVDIPRRRSSIKYLNLTDSSERIVYNEINPKEKAARRKFIIYDVKSDTCTFPQFLDRPLNKLRAAIIQMLSLDKTTSDIIDVAIGPSSLLKAIELSLKEFHFLKREFNQQRLIKTDTFEAIFNTDPELVVKDQSLLVTVQIPAEGKESLMLSRTLVDSDNKTQFLTVTICRVKNELFKNRINGVEYACGFDELMIQVAYYITTDLVSGSVVGRELDQTNDFDFDRDPFLQSVGIGCWRDEGFMSQKRFTPPSKQFSAEYETTKGESGVSYVAFDETRNLLRLDRFGRKSVYDSDKRKSYHVVQFVDLQQVMQEDSGRCIVLDMSDDSRIDEYFGMENLIGIGSSREGTPIYLGSKTVDHINYEVYEAEYYIRRFNGNLPIIFETREPFSHVDGSRYFLTYYMEEHKLDLEVKGDVGDDDDLVLIPRFIELWQVSSDRNKTLLNTLIFNAFSWSLDIEPASDTEINLSHLFYLDTCAQERSSQMQLRIRVTQDDANRLPARLETSFRRQKDLFRAALQRRVTSLLDISLMNIAQMDMKFIRYTVDLVADIRFTELVDGGARETMLGYVNYTDLTYTKRAKIIGEHYNRHSLADCKLDSLLYQTKNRLVYCKSLALCVIVETHTFTDEEYKGLPKTYDPSNPEKIMCQMMNFEWITTSSRDHGEGLLAKVNGNLYALFRQTITFPYKTRDFGKKVEFVKYKGDISVLGKIRSLESTGLAESRALLVGLRYELKESKTPTDVSEVIEIDSDEQEPFRYCLMACQLDEYCQSFSFCTRTKEKPNSGDCILSSLWLNQRRIEKIAGMLRSSADNKEISFGMSVGDEPHRLTRDSNCNLHPKDVLSSYKTSTSVYSKVPKVKGNDLMTVIQAQSQTTLEDCAALSYDMSLWSVDHYLNFTYCPLSSYCEPNEKAILISALNATLGNQIESEPCHVYQKSHDHLYESRFHAHLVLTIGESITDVFDYKKMANTEFSQVHAGLNREQCARLCNMRSSNCFAYDICDRTSKTMPICITFSIRSPLIKINPKKGLLTKESQFYGTSKSSMASLIGVMDCNHYALKKAYADIKVRQLLVKSNSAFKEGDKVRELEESISKQDEIIGNETELKLANERSLIAIRLKEQTGGLMRNFFLLLIGASIGCLGLLYGEKLGVSIVDNWDLLRARWNQRHREPRISQLGLANNIGLDLN